MARGHGGAEDDEEGGAGTGAEGSDEGGAGADASSAAERGAAAPSSVVASSSSSSSATARTSELGLPIQDDGVVSGTGAILRHFRQKPAGMSYLAPENEGAGVPGTTYGVGVGAVPLLACDLPANTVAAAASAAAANAAAAARSEAREDSEAGGQHERADGDGRRELGPVGGRRRGGWSRRVRRRAGRVDADERRAGREVDGQQRYGDAAKGARLAQRGERA